MTDDRHKMVDERKRKALPTSPAIANSETSKNEVSRAEHRLGFRKPGGRR